MWAAHTSCNVTNPSTFLVMQWPIPDCILSIKGSRSLPTTAWLSQRDYHSPLLLHTGDKHKTAHYINQCAIVLCWSSSMLSKESRLLDPRSQQIGIQLCRLILLAFTPASAHLMASWSSTEQEPHLMASWSSTEEESHLMASWSSTEEESHLMASWSSTEVPHCAVRSSTKRMEEGRWLRQARVRRSMALRSDRGRFSSPGVSVTCTHD